MLGDRLSDEAKHREVEATADKLVTIYGDRKWRKRYIFNAYKLSEAKIWENVERAASKKEPAKYFNWLCREHIKGNDV
jgi:hypothetical protein